MFSGGSGVSVTLSAYLLCIDYILWNDLIRTRISGAMGRAQIGWQPLAESDNMLFLLKFNIYEQS